MLLPVFYDKFWNNDEFIKNMYDNVLEIATIF